ncbi:hypothetical protein GCM10027578_27130 [Spirosoma luteolum]
MSQQQTLRDVLTAYLPEIATSEQRNAFFTRPDVSALLNEAECIISQLEKLWSATNELYETSTDDTIIPISPANESIEAPLMGGLNNDANKTILTPSTDLFSADESTVEPEAAPLSLPSAEPSRSIEMVSETQDTIQPTKLADDSVRMQPTQQLNSPVSQRTITIPNATVGKPYSYTFDFMALGFPPLAEHSLTVDASSGLTYEDTTQTLSGNPTIAGEFTYELSYRPQSEELNRPALRRQVLLLVNPDPRSLWKNLPSDTMDRYHRPDTAHSSIQTSGALLLGASVRGRSHAHEGTFRDDDFLLTSIGPDWHLLAVADGAGSARYARRGAQVACDILTTYLNTNVTEEDWINLSDLAEQQATGPSDTVEGQLRRQLYSLLGNAALAAYKAIEAEAQIAGAATKDFATTLLAVLAKPICSGWVVGGFGVGDGGIGIYRAGKEVVLLNTPDGGEYAGQTRFLTMPEIFKDNFFARFRFTYVPDLTAVILMTDGVTDPKFQTDSNLAKTEKWTELWSDITSNVSLSNTIAPDQLQEWLTFWSPGNHDDRTIAILYPHAHNHSY